MQKNQSKQFMGFILTTAATFLLGLIMTLTGNTASSDTGSGIMPVITFILAFMPILIVLIGMVGFDLPGMKVAPFAFVLAVLLTLTYFMDPTLTYAQEGSKIWAQTWSGIQSAVFIVGLIFFSFLILDMMQTSGAMDVVKRALAGISEDRRVQLIIVGLFVPIFMEGAAGAGTPAAIAAPFMVGLGFNPVLAVVVALMADGVCTSFGGSGLTTMSGGQDLVTAGVSTADLNFAAAGLFHMIGILVMPFLIIAFAYGKKGFKGKGITAYALYSGVLGGLVMFLLSNYIGGVVTDIGTGLIGIILAILGTKLIKIETPEEFVNQVPKRDGKEKYSIVRALSPYLFIMVLFPSILTGCKYIPCDIVNASTGAAYGNYWSYFVGLLTYNGWIDCLLFIVSILSVLTLRYGFGTYWDSVKRSFKKVIAVFVIMAALYSVANIMKIPYMTTADGESISMIIRLALDISNAAGPLYPAAAVLIGAIGAFITGTNLGSNQLFAHMHIVASENLGINTIMTFACNNGGGSLGNMICPNNVTAACATVGLMGEESKVMKRVALMFLICCVLYMVIGTLYVYVLLPHVDVNTAHLISAMG